MDKAKVLILTSLTGGGHVSLAEALRDQLERDCEVEIVDPQPAVIHWHYRLVSRHALWLWGAEYRAADGVAQSLRMHRLFTRFLGSGLENLLRALQPKLVLSTYPFLTYSVIQKMGRVGLNCPFGMLFADPDRVHHSWLTVKDAAAILAPTAETYQQALDAGVATERLHLTGWPVRDAFLRAAKGRAETLASLGLERDRFTVFLQGGGEGAARSDRAVWSLLGLPNVQVLLAVGTNRALARRYRGVSHIRTLPFTKNIAPYVAAADIVMGKAGPNMLFESVMLGKPFVATTFIPGQESGNLDFIRRHRLGWIATSAAEQRELIRALSTNPNRMAEARCHVAIHKDRNAKATQSIRPLISSLLERPMTCATSERSQACGSRIDPMPSGQRFVQTDEAAIP